MEHFNQLTPAQAERLAMLAEECGEVIQAVGKILRHGYDNYHPEQEKDPPELRYTNRQMLHDEVTDLVAVVSILEGNKDLPAISEENMLQSSIRKLTFAHHQKDKENA